ncbi:hypothetical protein [Rhizobacter sp. P5_C2]
MEEQRGGGSPLRGIKTPPYSPRVDTARPFPRTHRPLSRSSSDKARAEARQLLAERQLSPRPPHTGLSAPAPVPVHDGLDLASALERLTNLVRQGLLVGEFVRDSQRRASGAMQMKAGCDPGELARIAEVLEAEGVHDCAFQLRAALVMNATAADDDFMPNLSALVRLEPSAGAGLSEPAREALVAHLRTLRVLLSRNVFPRFGDLGYVGSLDSTGGPGDSASLQVDEVIVEAPFDRLNFVIVLLEVRWMLPDPMSMHDKVGELMQQLEPPKSARRRTFSRSGNFDLEKLTERVSNGRQWSGRTGWLLDSGLEQAFTALLDKRLVTCERAVDGDADSEILGFTLQPGCNSDTVADVAAALERIQPGLALLLWAAWAMNETMADGGFIAAITTVLDLKQKIEMPPLSLWAILGQLSTHARALLTLDRALEPDRVLLVSAPLHECSFLEGDELLEAVSKRACEVAELIRVEPRDQEPKGLRSAAIESLIAWGVSPSDSRTVVADVGALDALARLFSLQSFGSRVKQWVGDDKHGFVGFSPWQLGTSRDVLTVAAAFARAGRTGLALQLLAVHLTQLRMLADDDLPCVVFAMKIARKTDLLNRPAMRAMRAILLHGRLLKHCDLVADLQCGKALATLETSLIEAVLVGTGSTGDMLPIGTIDGVCDLLDGLAGQIHSDRQLQKIVQAAACLAAVDTGPGRRRIERSLQRAGGGDLLPDAKRFATLCEEHQNQVIAQLRMPLKDQGVQWKQGRFVEPSGSTLLWTSPSCMSAVTITHVRLCRPGRTSTASDASSLIKFLHPKIDASDIAPRAALLALGLRCSAAGPHRTDEALGAVLDQLLGDDKVREAMLEGDVSDLPVVMSKLIQAHWFTTDVRKKGLGHIVDSAEFATAMASGSAPCLLDEALAQIGADPMLLRGKRTRRLLRRMITPRACRGSLKAMVRPTLLQTLSDRSPRGAALIEALLLLNHDARKSLVDAVMKDVQANCEGVDLGDPKALTAALSHPITAMWSWRSGQSPPAFVMATPSLLSTWIGTGVADAGEPEKLLENLAAVLRQQRKDQGSEWRDSAAGLVFAARVALRASEGIGDDVLDAIVSPTSTRGSRKYGRSELFAHASLLACQWVLKRRLIPVEDTAQVALLARLMCAALALDMNDPAPGLDHLAWVEAHAGKVEQGLLAPKWFSDLRAKLHTELHALTP